MRPLSTTLYPLILAIGFLTPLATSAQIRLPVIVGGECAPLFSGGRQTQLANQDRRCNATTTAPQNPRPNQSIWFVVSQRSIRSRRSSENSRRNTRRRNIYVDNSNGGDRVSISFVLRGSKQKFRYSVRAFSGSQIVIDDPAPTTCEQIFNDFVNASLQIRSCTTDSECGKPLSGTSCGCTRDHVARKNADTTAFYALLDRAAQTGCSDSLPITSSCDCPSVSGTQCKAGICDWKVTDSSL